MGPEEWFAEVPGSKPLRSAGRPLAFSGLQIRDPDGNTLPAGEEGEIALRCEGQMDGYWGDPELSAQRVVDGWVLTSDIGKVDRNGYLYILDRRDDMIISGGSNIWPAELENAIAKHPAVVEVAVFGAPHERWGETPVAVCVLADPAAVTAEEIIRLCADELGSYKKPGVVHFQTEPLPKSPVGKIQRKALGERFWTGTDRRVSGS
jgi:acyl-CoA synthetase (AMP-forming)/AMP-acid ligase II